jgi:voltage-gated potassium channel
LPVSDLAADALRRAKHVLKGTLMTVKTTKTSELLNDSSYDLFILGIALYSMVILVALLFPLPLRIREALVLLDDWLCLIYIFDFVRSFLRAPSKLAYMKLGWLDLLAAVPLFPFALPSYIHFVRLIRLAQVAIILGKVHARDLWRQVKRRRAETTFLGVAFVALVLIGVASVTILLAEDGARHANIVSGSDALWWAISTVTTVGYGDRFPVTNTGRAIGVGLMLVGISLFGTLTSYLASTFLTSRLKQEDTDLEQIKGELAEIKALLRERAAVGEGQ